MEKYRKFLKVFAHWAEKENILAAALVGSYARGEAKPSSDVDLMIIADDPTPFLKTNRLIYQFGEVEKIVNETWGRAKNKKSYLQGWT